MTQAEIKTRDPAFVVIGAGDGVSNIVASLASRRGLSVTAVVTDEAAATKIRSTDPDISIICADLSKAADVAAVVLRLQDISKSKSLRGVVHFAERLPVGLLMETELATLRDALQQNAVSAYEIIQGLLPVLRRDSGRVVVVGARGGRTANPLLGTYTISTQVLAGLADVLRYEVWGTGVKVTLVESGPVATPMATKVVQQAQAITVSDTPRPHDLSSFVARAASGIFRHWSNGAQPGQLARFVMDVLELPNPKFRYTI